MVINQIVACPDCWQHVPQAMTGGAGQLRGSNPVHKDTANLFKWHLAMALTHCLNDQERGFIMDMVDDNFADVTEYPHATLGAGDDAKLAESLQIDLGLKHLDRRYSIEDIAERFDRKVPDEPDDIRNKFCCDSAALGK